MRRRLLVLLCCLTASAIAGDDDAARKDRERLQGSWNVLRMVESGRELPPAGAQALLVSVKGDKLTVMRDGKSVAAFEFKLDPRRTPPAVDFKHLDGPLKDRTMKGIYHIDKDGLTLCIDEEGRERPDEFASPSKTNRTLIVLRAKTP